MSTKDLTYQLTEYALLDELQFAVDQLRKGKVKYMVKQKVGDRTKYALFVDFTPTGEQYFERGLRNVADVCV